MTFQQYPFKGGIPSGNTAGRPGSPVIGDTYYNGQLEILEIYNGTTWVAVSAPPSTPQIVSVTDASSGDAYTTSTAGKLAVVMQAGSGGGTPSQYNAFTTVGGFSASSSSTTVTLTGLTPGTSYVVYGNAQNNFGTTVNTGNAAAVTPTTKPQAPTIGSASTSSVTTDVTVTWTLGSNGGKNLTAITITPYLNGTTAQTAVTAATTSSTSYTFTNLTVGSAYTFKVKTTTANGDSPESSATNSVTVPILVDYVVVAGGGGGGDQGGGGAGGMKSGTTNISLSTAYTVTVGAAGAKSNSNNASGFNGGNSVFATITSTGGGGGGDTSNGAGKNGGSGGGGSAQASTAGTAGGTGISGEGNNGGGSGGTSNDYVGAGGGGKGAAGSNWSDRNGGNGGAGGATSISGSSVTYAGGGGGGTDKTNGTGTAGTGGAGGGGNGFAGTSNGTAQNGGTNTGGGGGGANGSDQGNGGSGIVIIKIPNTYSATFSGGVTQTMSTAVSGFKVYTITAAGISDTVTFS